MTAITTQIPPTPIPISPTIQTINISQGPSGKKLRRPITILIPEPRSLEEKNLQQYVITAFTVKMPSLIDFAFRNTSVLEVAKHLKRHTTGSDATLSIRLRHQQILQMDSPRTRPTNHRMQRLRRPAKPKEDHGTCTVNR